MKITNWGNYPTVDAGMHYFRDAKELQNFLEKGLEFIPRGLGRCYGDSSLNKNILSTQKYNRVLQFDRESGILSCESGIGFDEILGIVVFHGWFLPVVPGTKFITLGGAVASNIHGKNHHKEGGFSNHVLEMDVMLSDGTVYTCSNKENPELFWATCGGMGLTGIILKVTVQLKKIKNSYISQKTIIANNLSEVFELFEQNSGFTYSVAWIDCLAKEESLGRSALFLGEHANDEELSKKQLNTPFALFKKKKLFVPFFFPEFSLNHFSVKAFNEIIFQKEKRFQGKKIVHYDPFFFPLDSILNWNRIYGRKGFLQYQFVLPKESSEEGMKKILRMISERGFGSFLAVLKLFGKGSDGFLSFPREGYTLALDFPFNHSILEFLNELDRIVFNFGGRIYLTKDARMNKEMFMGTYKRAEEFINSKYHWDKYQKLRSLQSKRIGI